MIKENIFKNKSRFHLNNNKKVLFLIYGLVNVLITNLLLQILLLFFPIFFATLISQIFNLNFGFYIYGLKVFKVKFLGKKIYLKYLFLHLLIWILNWFLINFIYCLFVLPSILVKDNGTICKYWFFGLIIIYILTYFRLNSFVKKKIDI